MITLRKGTWLTMFLLVAFLAGGCAPTFHKALNAELAGQAEPMKVVSTIPKEEVCIHFVAKTHTNYSGGLLFALIDAGINKSLAEKAEERVVPLLEASADVNAPDQFWTALEEAMDESSWLKVESFERRTAGYTNKELKDIETPYLLMTTTYELSSDSRVLAVQTRSYLYMNKRNKPDYFGFYTYYSDSIGENDEKDEEAISLWAADDASAYREALREGIEENIRMAKLDLLDNPANPKTEEGEEIKFRMVDPISEMKTTFQGQVLDRTEDRFLMREKGGNLFSIATGLVEEK